MSSYEQFCNRVQTLRKSLLDSISYRIPRDLRRRISPEDVFSEITSNCPPDVEELLQLPAKRFEAWLREVSYRKVISLIRKHLYSKCRSSRREIHDSHSGSPEHPAEYAASSEESPIQHAIRKDNCEHLRTAMAQLRGLDRDILTMHFFESRSLQEVADILGLPIDVCRQRDFRARQKLARMLPAGMGA